MVLITKNVFYRCQSIVFCLLFFSFGTKAQTSNSLVHTTSVLPVKPRLFDSDSVLKIKLSGNIKELLNDRSEKPKYHPIEVSYVKEDNTQVSIKAQAKTRGHFRKLRENCSYPPLQLRFMETDSLKHSVFAQQQKLKLVMPCKDDGYVIREWLVYKLYNLVTSKCFKARLVLVSLSNNKSKKTITPFYGILLEEEGQMAARNNDSIIGLLKLSPEQTETNAFLKMAAFQYMIGNTDWSVQYLQNIKLIAAAGDRSPTAVPYDFDHAGIVSAPYAEPAEELAMISVRERRYRGYCVADMKAFDPVIAFYNSIKKDVYDVYNNCSLLDAKYLKATIKYLDEFYETINDPELAKEAFNYPCDKNGTGNAIIKGLRKD
jgi:hypothetical protein